MSLDLKWAARRRAIEASGTWISPVGSRPHWRKVVFNGLLALFAFGLRLTPAYARGLRNALDLRRVELEIAVPGLPPSFEGYRILQLSDTHLDVMPALAGVARRLLEGAEVDLLVVTGDVLGRHDASVALAADLLMEALADVRVNGPCLAILGNHDPVEMVGTLEARGFEVLINRSRTIEKGGDVVRIIGLDDVHNFYTEAARAAFESDGVDEQAGACRMALVHSAEMADVAAAAGCSLYLAGHTHGGQICLPGGRPLVTQLQCCKHCAVGLWQEGAMIGYTSTGLGVSHPPVRFNCRGEVTIFTLRCAGDLANRGAG